MKIRHYLIIFFTLPCLFPSLTLSKTITIPDVGTIDIPDSMKVGGELNKILEQKLIVIPKNSRRYSRIIVSVYPQKAGDPYRLHSNWTIDPDTLKRLGDEKKQLIEKELSSISSKLVEWHTPKMVDVNGIRAVNLTYKRQLFKQPHVIVKQHIFHNYDRLITVTISYRVREKKLWQKALKKSLSSLTLIDYAPKTTEEAFKDEAQWAEEYLEREFNNALIIFIVGLIPSLFIRFRFVKKQMSVSSSIGTALGFFIFYAFLAFFILSRFIPVGIHAIVSIISIIIVSFLIFRKKATEKELKTQKPDI